MYLNPDKEKVYFNCFFYDEEAKKQRRKFWESQYALFNLLFIYEVILSCTPVDDLKCICIMKYCENEDIKFGMEDLYIVIDEDGHSPKAMCSDCMTNYHVIEDKKELEKWPTIKIILERKKSTEKKDK